MDIPGYNTILKNRMIGHGGGFATFIKKHIAYRIEQVPDNLEAQKITLISDVINTIVNLYHILGKALQITPLYIRSFQTLWEILFSVEILIAIILFGEVDCLTLMVRS